MLKKPYINNIMPKNPNKPNKSKREPIYVSDPNDPKYRAYNDSLILSSKNKHDDDWFIKAPRINGNIVSADSWSNHVSSMSYDKFNKAYDRLTKLNKEEPAVKGDKTYFKIGFPGIPGSIDTWYTKYKEPVQPVVLQKKVTPEYLPMKSIPQSPEPELRASRPDKLIEQPQYTSKLITGNGGYNIKQYFDDTGKLVREEYYDMSGKRLPKMANGGKFWDGLGNVAANTGLAVADTGLSALGATNVIKDDMYKGSTAQGFSTAGNIAGGIAKAGAPMAANVLLGPGAGMALNAVQSGVGSATQQSYPQQPQGFNPISMIGPAMQMGMRYPMGGQVGPNAELEKQENTLNPDGSTNQYNGPTHSQGGIKTQLDPGTLVFSDRLKMGKKTFAELNKVNNTSKEDKVLNDPKAKGVSKLTAELMKMAKNKQSLKLYEAQENLKAEKMNKYAQKMAYGGKIPKYAFGDTVPPDYTPSQLPNGIMGAGYQPGLYQQTVAAHYGAPVHPMGLGATNMAYQGPGVVPQQNLANQGVAINPTVNPSISNYDPSMSFSPNNTSGLPSGYDSQAGGGSNVNWGNVATQAALGVAQNAGNIYDLYRTRKSDVEKYERYNPTLLDPTQAISDNNMTFKGAVNSAREASVGNSSTFLNNRRALASERMRANARIRKEFENANAGIKNQAGFYNNDLAKQEIQNNLANKARNEDIRANAIASIGKNAAGQYTDYNRQNTAEMYERDLLNAIEAQYPGAQANPALRAYYKKYNRTGK